MNTTRPDLTDQEVDAICAGLTQNAAKCKHLQRLGLHVTRKPNGRPLVMRAHAEQVLAGLQPAQAATAANDSHNPAPAGDRAALVLLFGRKAA